MPPKGQANEEAEQPENASEEEPVLATKLLERLRR